MTGKGSWKYESNGGSRARGSRKEQATLQIVTILGPRTAAQPRRRNANLTPLASRKQAFDPPQPGKCDETMEIEIAK